MCNDMPNLKSGFILLLAFCVSSFTAHGTFCSDSPVGGGGQCKVPEEAVEPLICVVVRTYRGHGEGQFPYLEELLHSLKSQTVSR